MEPLISISIPTLNEEKNIKKCLESIRRQKIADRIEVFVVDGGSDDKTIQIAKKYKAIILRNPKKDAESGKLIGLKAATGKYFMILDADMELEGHNWFQKMLKPLLDDTKIVGSFTKFVIKKSDSFLSHYISIDPIQRDPLFRFLTPGVEDVMVRREVGYQLCHYFRNKIVPAGFCLYRRHDLVKIGLLRRQKFMELDNLSIFIRNRRNQFAYVPSAGIHHPFLKDVKTLIRKRIRNLDGQFFNQPDRREFTWVDFSRRGDIFKLIIWVIYAYSVVMPIFVGIMRAVRYKDMIALYEPIFVLITTSLIIYAFISKKEGRMLVSNFLLSK